MNIINGSSADDTGSERVLCPDEDVSDTGK
jgi:hypothetical protein